MVQERPTGHSASFSGYRDEVRADFTSHDADDRVLRLS
jgi:hypothetical protein